ncbi:hypothetical protein [Chlorogloeopsis sp. ULAP02]|uniref:hypothetical protein n=1 Tax=Chlorogloeopsis sp. ULAP02 TaxID=3107926 RepID=UPI003136E58D
MGKRTADNGGKLRIELFPLFENTKTQGKVVVINTLALHRLKQKTGGNRKDVKMFSLSMAIKGV